MQWVLFLVMFVFLAAVTVSVGLRQGSVERARGKKSSANGSQSPRQATPWSESDDHPMTKQ